MQTAPPRRPAPRRLQIESPIPNNEPDNTAGRVTSAPRHANLRILLSVVIVDLIGFAIVVPILPFYAEQYGAGGFELGCIVAGFSLFQFIFAPLWGRLSDRFGRRPVLLFTIAGNTAAMIFLGLADSLTAIFAARMLAGAFAGNIGVATAYITDVTNEDERPRWMGLIGASFAIGFTLGPVLGGVASTWGYSTPMYLAAGLSALNLISAIARLPESPRKVSDSPEGALSRLAALRQPGVRLLTATNFVFSFAVTQLETVFALYMLHRFEFNAFEVAMVLFAMAVVMGGIQGGGMKALSKRFGERSLVRSGALFLASGFFLTPLMPSVAWLIGALMLCATGRALLQPSLMTLISFRTSEDSRGSIMSTFQSAAALARVFGPFAAGLIYDRAAGGPFWVAGAASLLVFALATALTRARPTDAAPAT